MPLNIVVLSASKQSWWNYRSRSAAIPGLSWIKDFICSRTNLLISDKSNIHFSSCEYYGLEYRDNNNNRVIPLEKVVGVYKHPTENKTAVFQEIYEEGLARYALETAKAAVVIYYINVLPNETPEAFATRAEEELTLLQQYDFSDAHVTKHIIINFSSITDPEFKNDPALDRFGRFTLSQGFKTTDNYKNACFTFDIGDPEKGVVNEYLDTLIRAHSAPNILSRFLGSVFYLFLGGITALLLFNPLNVYFTIWSNSCWETPLDSVLSCVWILLAPVVYIFTLGQVLITATNFGWNRGWLVGLESPFYVAKNNFFHEKVDFNPRNLFASLVIIGLTTGAVLLTLGLLGPTVVGGVGLAALAVKGATIAAGFIGISSSNVALGVVAATAAVVAGSIIYGIGYGVYLGIKAGFNLLNSFIQSSETNTTTPLSSQGPLLHYPPVQRTMQPTQEVLGTPLTKSSIPVVTPPGEQQYPDSFGPASYCPVLTPTQAATAPPKPPPPNARSVPYTELPPRPQYPLSLNGVPLPFSSYPDPLPPGAWVKIMGCR